LYLGPGLVGCAEARGTAAVFELGCHAHLFWNTEFNVPLAGIPITITRTYDSLDRDKIEDFGFGWRLGTFVDLSVDAQNNVTMAVASRRCGQVCCLS